MSARGIGILGKNNSLIRSFEERKNVVKQRKDMKEAKRRNLGERIYAGYGNIMHGEVWHEYNYTDPRLRTHNEALKDQQEDLKRQELAQEINRETIKAGDDILKPEYRVKLMSEKRMEELQYYDELARRKLKDDVYKALSEGDNPVLMGDKYMRDQATDSQMKEMIDRAEKVRDEMMENDRYIRREDYYEAALERAAENMNNRYGALIKDVNHQDMVGVIEQHYASKTNTDFVQAKQEIEAFKRDLQDYERNKQILEQIDNRKEEIKKEVDSYIDDVNKYRKQAGMEEYKVPTVDEGGVGSRRVRTIEQRTRK